MNVAAIDIGSNSIHMVVARIDAHGQFTILDRAKEAVRLGTRTLTSHTLSAETIRAGLEALGTFKRLAETRQVERIMAVATSAVREARNGGDFIAAVGREHQIHVDVITGREEARLISLAVSNAVDLTTAPALLVDIGGGSVEFVLARLGELKILGSLKVGVIRLAERHLTGDPPSRDEVAQLEAVLERQLAPVCARASSAKVERVVGTSGTMLNLAAIAAHLQDKPAPERLNAVTVSAKQMRRVLQLLLRSDRAHRRRIPGLDRRRVDIIVPGAVLVEYLMRALDVRELVVCDWALREGILLDFIERHRDEIEESESTPDVRRRSVLHLGSRPRRTAKHAAHVARLALSLFDQTVAWHGYGAREREWLEYGALLHDVGDHVAHTRHHRHSSYLIRNAELMGFEPSEIQLLAALARYHRKGGPKDTDEEMQQLPARLRGVVSTLAALLRVADGLDRSHFRVVRQMTVTRDGDTVTLQVRTGGQDAALEVWAATRKADLFARVFAVEVQFQIQ